MGAANVGLALLLAGRVGWGLYGVAAAGVITLTARNLVFTPLYNAYCLGRSPLVFYRAVLGTMSVAVVTAVGSYGVTRLVDVSGWFRLGTVAAAVSLVYLVVVLLTQVSTDERAVLREAVRSLVRNGQGATS
jgi:membrane protein EpsK